MVFSIPTKDRYDVLLHMLDNSLESERGNLKTVRGTKEKRSSFIAMLYLMTDELQVDPSSDHGIGCFRTNLLFD